MNKYIYSLVLLAFSYVLGNAQTVNISTPAALQAALDAAKPGQTIVMAPGRYFQKGGFKIKSGIKGTANQPITLAGTSDVVLETESVDRTVGTYALYLAGKNDYWILDGFSVRLAAKGIVTDSASHTIIRNIRVTYIGAEGIHLRSFSSYNTIENCFVDSMGQDSYMKTNGYAEGIYIGSANGTNWTKYTGGKPDTCNYNIVSACSFGDFVPSENIDIKEGTVGGTITGCVFNGKGLNGANSADSWIDVKGDRYTIECNTGTTIIGAAASGYQVHENTVNSIVYGHDNIFSNNQANIASGLYAFYLHKTGMSTICSNNSVTGGLLFKGTLTNCTSTASCLTTGIVSHEKNTTVSLYPNPASDVISISISTNTKANYFICDVLGKIVKTGSVSAHNSIIDISSLNNGLYFFNSAELKSSLKFIKE